MRVAVAAPPARNDFPNMPPRLGFKFTVLGFYKYFAPTALGRRPKPGTGFAADSAVGATSL
jgi:hypothetical protein